MSNLNDFNREAKAALWVVLQWLLLAVPTGLVCGAVGTAFHLSVEYVTELRAAQSWLLLCLPLAGLAVGFWQSMDEVRALRVSDRVFSPERAQAECDEKYRLWKRAVSCACGWIEKA